MQSLDENNTSITNSAMDVQGKMLVLCSAKRERERERKKKRRIKLLLSLSYETL